ncbi:tRNA (N6-threonylcarbamoyladenosine(37)-N6)-methyltransferase TrmO [Ruminococcus sp. J1101004sp1_RTP21198st1_B9_RTP21198_201120]|uniref:tRNA (N6-threonylcarbamoyladenosine(37)-N6)-methyltransferase TrmO n=1 Tax=Ruminococcus sp. J1101004sp1_RTP21198st1_B9_RTP21198_201120 TaxID=3141597 RepID=UPI0034A4591B
MKVIAHIRSDFPTKFGIPHQSCRIQELKADIIFEPEYRNHEAFRGLEEYTHIWLIWEFSQAVRKEWSPTVRPPRLGGNVRMGVFATRSPFRPNPIGLSSVRLESVEFSEKYGPVLHVSGADLMDGTPIYDIKPYLAYVDSHPEAAGGFTDQIQDHKLKVEFPEELLKKIPVEKREALLAVLANDPRPGYQKDPERKYGMSFGSWDIHFKVDGEQLRVLEVFNTFTN